MSRDARDPMRTVTLLVAAATMDAGVGAASGALGPNPANHGALLDAPIEGYRYDGAERCTKRVPPGTKAMVRWLERHTSGELWGIGRGGALLPRQLQPPRGEPRDRLAHGRAGRKSTGREAMKLIREWLLAPDRNGNENALARRMGVQGIIYDCRAWFSGPDGLGDYSYCFKGNGKRKQGIDLTAAHIDHIHIELNWPGARERTSFWRR